MRCVSLALVMLIGCADHGAEGMFIVNNTAPSGSLCTLTGDPVQPFLAHGAISVDSPEPYLITPLVQSRITSIVGQETEHTIHLEGARVTLSTANTSGTLVQSAQFTALFSGSVPPSATVNVSFALVPVSVIQSAAAAGTDVEVSAHIVAYGTLGNDEIDAEPFDYPITICKNCITIRHTGGCPLTSVTNLGNPCNPYQDGTVDCCTDTNNQLQCPAPTM